MPYNLVMPKFKAGTLKSGLSNKTVTNRKQAIAIMLSEKAKANDPTSSKSSEYKATSLNSTLNPSRKLKMKFGLK